MLLPFAGSQGNFQLNVYKPVILHNVLESIQLLREAVSSFNDRCAAGIEPNRKRIREHLENSLMLVTARNPYIGYEKAAQISLKAYRGDRRSGRLPQNWDISLPNSSTNGSNPRR
jgi:fumarate hydratase class II